MTTHEILSWQHETEHEVGFAMDRFGNISHMGPGWTMLTGESPRDVLHSAFADLVHPADRPPVLEALQSLIRGEIYSCRMPARCLRGERGDQAGRVSRDGVELRAIRHRVDRLASNDTCCIQCDAGDRR